MKQVIYIKKPILFAILITAGIISGFLLFYILSFFGIISVKDINNGESGEPVANGNSVLTSLAYNVLKNIINDDFNSLSHIVHPEFGVVFSPGATINLTANKRFDTSQISAMGSDSNVYIWGVYEDSGAPIEMTAAGYFSEFISAKSFIDAPYIAINRIARSGNALENIMEVFPDVKFVDFYLPGGDRDSGEEPDWSILRLGFEEYNSELRLTIIINSKRID